ncbi:iron-sulfur cluster assembly protein [Blastococcus sp. MG754426]|uniref:iron-sulfur cluster assembly protein n=1 Tax=unclassified Blastococcus TaxID=2619396 RepID=UPI001EEF9D7F|nr:MULTISPECIES: iron-sulfur cluster assembly protein [unclassified Blastococcus]MCF6506648.1 iron-sulfur cluster assembly protein [Blastococcus sp. MG754426]MCF6510360.1 iron-sulfur cluster assembly protein [Blastococcus sp. MG754427]MCF6735748.1 iron-sulfur cluster assembly protein [Blastococcus sp. KM273129]
MTAVLPDLAADVRAALGAVVDPELDEPITDLGFVRSVSVTGGAVEVHLRLPTSFCAPNFAWLMASDARDAVAAVPGVASVLVELDDHHDSDLINRGLAAGAGYRGTFGHEAEESLDELRATFARKAHTAAMERAVTALLRTDPAADVAALVLGDLPTGERTTEALLQRRAALGLPVDDDAPVLVDAHGTRPAPEAAALFLRRARSVRISIDGNAHFCRGLLTTRYPGSEADQAPRPEDRPLLSLTVSKESRP